MEEDSEQTSNEATPSYLDYLANLDSEQVREEVAKRSAATKEYTRKLLHYVEMSGQSTLGSTALKESTSDESIIIDVVGTGNKGIAILLLSVHCSFKKIILIYLQEMLRKFF